MRVFAFEIVQTTVIQLDFVHVVDGMKEAGYA